MPELTIERTWDGAPARADERVRIDVRCSADELQLRVQAPHHGDPPPTRPAGHCEGLWEFEVVELFLLGASEHYVEIELGPHGHYLILELRGRRQRVATLEPLRVQADRLAGEWRGELALARAALPGALCAWNAYAIHGCGSSRRYLAHAPVPGPAPDFHRLECFAPVPASLWEGAEPGPDLTW